MRQIVIDVPEKVLIAEKTDEIGFSRNDRYHRLYVFLLEGEDDENQL